MNSFFIAYENGEWCYLVVNIGFLALPSLYCVSFLFFLVFLWVLLLEEVLRPVW